MTRKTLYDELLDSLEAASTRLDKFLGMGLPEKDSRVKGARRDVRQAEKDKADYMRRGYMGLRR